MTAALKRIKVTWPQGCVCAPCGAPYSSEEDYDRQHVMFGRDADDARLTEWECYQLGYAAGTEWTTCPDDELQRFVEYLYERIGVHHMDIATGHFGGGNWWGAYMFALDRLVAIEAHRGAEWLDPISARLREHWNQVVEEERSAAAISDLADERAGVLFPCNPEAREAFAKVVLKQWWRMNCGEAVTEP